jgi:hypothetical protein
LFFHFVHFTSLFSFKIIYSPRTGITQLNNGANTIGHNLLLVSIPPKKKHDKYCVSSGGNSAMFGTIGSL